MTALNMAQFIAPKSDQLNADDLIGGPITIRITRVNANEASPEQPINVFFENDDGKPFRPCKSMRRVMVAVWGPDASQYVGRAMTLYRDPNVQFGGMQVGGIRISHMSHIDEKKTMALTETRAKRKPYTVQPLKDAPGLTQGQAKPDPAQKWADAFIAKVGELTDATALNAFVVEKNAKLTELQEKRPDLHGACMSAAVKRESELAAPADDPLDEDAALFGEAAE